MSVSVCGFQVRNLRSGVSRVAVCTLGDLYCYLQRAMDQEVEATARALLHKAAESNAFIRQDVDAALGHMARHCTPARCINALLVGGLRSGRCTHTKQARTRCIAPCCVCWFSYHQCASAWVTFFCTIHLLSQRISGSCKSSVLCVFEFE